MRHFNDIEIVKICWSLGVLGFSVIDLERHGLWINLEEKISSINFDSLRKKASIPEPSGRRKADFTPKMLVSTASQSSTIELLIGEFAFFFLTFSHR
jgi:hypothetical protein